MGEAVVGKLAGGDGPKDVEALDQREPVTRILRADRHQLSAGAVGPERRHQQHVRLGFLTPERAREIYGLTDADIDNGKAGT